MLSTFNLPGKNISPDKQMSMMRTYLNQLKDEMESELYNIRWENLSKDLQDTINSLKSYSAESDDKINAINANYVSTDYLTANYITAADITATYATITSLNAVSADITELSTKKLDATTAYIDFMEVRNWVSAGYIKADKIDAQTLASMSFSSFVINVTGIYATGFLRMGGYEWNGGTIQVKDINGATYRVPSLATVPGA